MFLAADIGNTRIKAGLFEGDKLLHSEAFGGEEAFLHFIEDKSITAAAFASVVPQKTDAVTEAVKSRFSFPVEIISRSSPFNLKIVYNSPETLGIDRICSAEGAYYLFKSSGAAGSYNERDIIISADFGTASTINIIRYPGEFHGGTITPGVEMMFRSLNTGTAQLPLVTPEDYSGYTGSTTKESIASGVINAQIGLLERIVIQLRMDNSACRFHLYITGGNANPLLPYLPRPYTYEPHLVLYGIKSVYHLKFNIPST